jgi:hypothetical protein
VSRSRTTKPRRRTKRSPPETSHTVNPQLLTIAPVAAGAGRRTHSSRRSNARPGRAGKPSTGRRSPGSTPPRLAGGRSLVNISAPLFIMRTGTSPTTLAARAGDRSRSWRAVCGGTRMHGSGGGGGETTGRKAGIGAPPPTSRQRDGGSALMLPDLDADALSPRRPRRRPVLHSGGPAVWPRPEARTPRSAQDDKPGGVLRARPETPGEAEITSRPLRPATGADRRQNACSAVGVARISPGSGPRDPARRAAPNRPVRGDGFPPAATDLH